MSQSPIAQKARYIVKFLLFGAQVVPAAAQNVRMAAAQIVVKRRLGKLVVPVPAGDGGVDLPRRDGRRTECSSFKSAARAFKIQPEPPQVVKLVAAAESVKASALKSLPAKNALSAAASTVPFSL